MKPSETPDPNDEMLKCPECKHPLKKRRTRTPDACEMVCGGCGKQFDICDADMMNQLKGETPP